LAGKRLAERGQWWSLKRRSWFGNLVLVCSQSEIAREVNEMIGEIETRWMMVDWKVSATLRWSKTTQGGASGIMHTFLYQRAWSNQGTR
jgi:hypothetical protein